MAAEWNFWLVTAGTRHIVATIHPAAALHYKAPWGDAK